ncbi:MAG: hypothetical protein P8Y45_24170 [Exilibacterium sp.]
MNAVTTSPAGAPPYTREQDDHRSSPRLNPGVDFQRHWIDDMRINLSAVERRAAAFNARRSLKREWQAAWLLKAVSCIDLTTLSGQDTTGRVRRLCAKARQPLEREILTSLGVEHLGITTAAVCVYHEMVATATAALAGCGIPVAAVSTGFPAGLSPFATRLEEIKASVSAGAEEIDIVIVGFKPAGGIGTAKDAINYLVLIKEELGDNWLGPNLFRFGASSLLADIERQLQHHVSGRYSAAYHHPLA